MRVRDMINGVDYADLMEQQMFCFGSDDSPSDSGGGNDEPQGTVFGVDGRSKTGSTAQDAAIGFTDGSGGRGANYGALDNATVEQTTAAVAAAQAVANAGGSQLAQQDAVANALGNYQTGAVNRAGNLTDAGQSLVNAAADQALAFERTYKAAAPVARALGMPADATPMTAAEKAALDQELNQFLSGNASANAVATSRPNNMGAGVSPSGSLTVNRMGLDGNILNTTTTNFGGVQPLSLAGQVLQNNLSQGAPSYNIDYNTPLGTPVSPSFPDPEADRVRALSNQFGEVYYDETTGTYKGGADPRLTGEAFSGISQDMADQIAMADTGMVNTDQSPFASDYTDGMMVDSGVMGVGKLPQAPVLRDGQYYMGGVPVTDELAQTAIDTRASIIDALPSPNAGFIQQGLGFLTGQDPVGMAAKQYGEFLNLDGAMINPETGNVSAPAGRGTLNLNNQMGTVTYSGMPDPNYTGAYANLVNPSQDREGGDDQVVAPVTNPMTGASRCPDGYVFDEDLQACRLDTGMSGGAPTPTNPAPSGIYFRETGLDQAPANLPSGFDFGAANRRFVESYGNRPDFYRKPMSLTGFRKL